jgi:hypothetical protein
MNQWGSQKGHAMTAQLYEDHQTDHLSPETNVYYHRMRVLELTVQLLITRTNAGDYWAEGISDVQRLLEAVPMPYADRREASGHLQNAVSDCQKEEFDAATFELRALRECVYRL